LIKQINPGATIRQEEERLRPENSEVFRLFGDNSKLLAYTGWKPQTSLEEGLRQTIEWFKHPDNLKQYKADIYNI
jgi:nucleoside-diphosphate-sugar epimerase